MINISRYTFEGPYTSTSSLRNAAGIYAILTDGRVPNNWTVIDIGESSEVKTRIENHDRQACWNRNNRGTLAVAVLYTSGWTAEQRRVVEAALRKEYAPVCGAA